MPHSFDLDSASAQLHLSEAIVWCTNRQLTATPLENSEIRRRLKLLDQAAELMRQAYLESGNVVGRFLRRDYSKTRKYQQALDLMAQVNPASLPSVIKRLRSPELQPSLELSQAQTEQAKEQIVRSVVSKRSALIPTLQHRQTAPHGAQGRLLRYWPEENLADGAAEYASVGFFDADNTPPWDSWVMFSSGMLVSWVPGELIELVDRGVDANPEGCIAWFD
jgi:hypothetical protein